MSEIQTIDAGLYRLMLCSGAALLRKKRGDIDKLNVFPVPDGDTGSNMCMTLNAVSAVPADGEDLSSYSEKASKAAMRGARGNSGVILSLFIRGTAKYFNGRSEASLEDLIMAFRCGAEEARKAVLKPVEGTILTVMRECCSADLSEYGCDMVEAMKTVYDHAEKVLARTPEMLPVLKKAGVVDSGGCGFCVVLCGMINALTGETDMNEESEPGAVGEYGEFDAEQFSDDDIRYTFCTECLLNRFSETTDDQTDELRKWLSENGDSIVMACDKEIIKIHVHTSIPFEAVERACLLGDPRLIKIENMRQQHSELISSGKGQKKLLPFLGQLGKNLSPLRQQSRETIREKKKYGIVSVVNGGGLSDLFKELGAAAVVNGGQSMNPSTDDILKAVSELCCETVFVLPNNSNIIMAANQAAELAEDVRINVIPSRTVPQGIAAMIAFEGNAEPEENIAAMTEAMKTVTTLSVTKAVRNAVLDDLSIRRKQYLGLVNNKIRYASDTIEECITSLAGTLKGKDTVTIYYGSGVSEKAAEKVSAIISNILGGVCTVDMVKGGQPIYPYIISAE